MKVSRKVAWSRGLLMLPQHLQQQDRYHESLLAARFQAADPQAYGALRIELDDDALRNGRVVLVAFEGILPDGTPLSLGPGTELPTPPARDDVAEHIGASERPVAVYLALADERENINNYDTNGAQSSVRYRVANVEVADRAQENRAGPVPLAAPNIRLLFGDEARDAYSTLQIAEIVPSDSQRFIYSDGYIPPCLRVSATPALTERLKDLRALMIARHQRLMEQRRETADGRTEFTTLDVTRYLKLAAINSTLPLMHYLINVADVPPRAAFLTLSQLVGQLATFDSAVDMTEPLPFDFDNLRTTFNRVLSLAEELLQTTEQEQHVTCDLEVGLDGLHRSGLDDPRIQGRRRYLIAVKGSLPNEEIERQVPLNAKIASSLQIELVRQQNIHGVPVRLCKRLPVQVPRRRGWSYFDIPAPEKGTDPAWKAFWDGMWVQKSIAVWLPPSFGDDAEVKLIGVLDV